MQILFLVQIAFVLLFSFQTRAQSNSSFVSAEDRDLTVKSVTVVPFTDNISGIYSKPLFKKFSDMVSQDKFWAYGALPENTNAPLDLDENPAAVKSLLSAAKVDGLFSFRLIKGSKGMNGRLIFFAGQSGLPLIQEEIKDYPGFEIADIEKQLASMYGKIKARLPYRGMIVSRRSQEVTINLGFRDGIKNGDEISVVQILKINRHPKLKFMISTEKEILGKIKVYKTDDSLSFANIIFEKETGVLQVGAKLLSQDFVNYGIPVRDKDGKLVPGLENRSDKDLSYGEGAKEWVPQGPPQYGRIAILAGLGMYGISSKLATGSIDTSTSTAPEIAVKGELWFSSEWTLLYGLKQSVFSVSNPQGGSTPGSLNMSLSSYSVLGAYNFLMSDDFFGPKLQISAGYSTFNSHTDQSTPVSFTNMSYGGLLVGLAGQFPLSAEVPMDLGAQFNLFLNPSFTESGGSSGSSPKSTINQFGFFGVYHWRPRFKIRGEVNFEYYSTDFSGSAPYSTNSTQKLTSFMGGIEYLF